tara:strand:+ start:610 stop:1650 length:1041 start_codon:yes stop_codon:yes gene_type:complete
MAYIGQSPVVGLFKKVDDISSGFNDSTTQFTLASGGVNLSLGAPENLIVSVDGVIQEPGSGKAYTTAGSQITFTEAPNTNATFFAVQLGEVGVNLVSIQDGSITTAKIKDDAVTTAKIQDDAITTPLIADDQITQALMANDAIGADELADDAVGSAAIADGGVLSAALATDSVTSLKIAPNTVLRGKIVFSAAVQEKANVLTSNIKGTVDAQGEDVINVDPLNNSVLFFTGNSHSNTSHTLNFINMGGVQVGNTVSFVCSISNNVSSFANISNVRIDGNEARGHDMRKASNDLNSNTLFVSGGPIAAGAGIGGDGTANVNVYSFNITSMRKEPDVYSVFVSRSNFT